MESYQTVRQVLSSLQPTIVIAGACGLDADDLKWGEKINSLEHIGADRCAWDWCRNNLENTYNAIPLLIPARWKTLRKSAGPIRNQLMLDILLSLKRSGYEVEVLGFPLEDSVGTWDMMQRARAASVSVSNYGHNPGAS